MKKLILVLCIIAYAYPCLASHSPTQLALKSPKTDHPLVATHSGTMVVDIMNKTDPVNGHAVNGRSFAIYKGKRYGLSCGCSRSTFMNDPEKYINKLRKMGEIE
ncbi:MAG: hypothetical protein ABH871_00770 [Pseudomonadota bacterium]